MLCSILNRDTSFDFVPNLFMSGKVFSLSMLIGGYLVLNCYCAALVSHLTVKKIAMPFEDLEGFLDSEYKLAQLYDGTMQLMKYASNTSSYSSEKNSHFALTIVLMEKSLQSFIKYT